MTQEQRDKQIAYLVRRKHAAKREIGCLEEHLKTIHRGLTAIASAVNSQAWARLSHEGSHVVVASDQRQQGGAKLDDVSLSDIADMGQRILQLTEQIKADEKSLLRCLGEEET